MEEYRTHLYARLKHRNVDELIIKKIMQKLTLHCKDYVYDSTLPADINRINAAEQFDSILQSYDFIEVYKKEDTRKFLQIGTEGLIVYFMYDLEDEIKRYGKFIGEETYPITDNMRLGLYEVSIPDVRARILTSFKSLGKELSDTEVDSVLNQLDAWVDQGYLNKYYWTDFETFFGNPEKKFPKKKFCCEIFELLSRLEMSPTYITPARFKEFCSLLFLFKLSKESGALDTAWNRACGKIY